MNKSGLTEFLILVAIFLVLVAWKGSELQKFIVSSWVAFP